MTKTKTEYVCQNCGAKAPKWIGKCPSCQEWNTYVEEITEVSNKKQLSTTHLFTDEPKTISQITGDSGIRVNTQCKELNRVLGGGLVPGSLILIGGEPGIGKSTLALQVALQMKEYKTLYISGEESLAQLKIRAERIGIENKNCYFLCETTLEIILHHAEKLKPDLLIIDSIQTLQTEFIESSPGSVSQVRDCAARLQRLAKASAISIFIIGHINKEGNIAGPKVLEHIVDTVLQIEGDHNFLFRILRSTKNRFGSTSELGIFEMHNNGLIEVENPSEILISHRDEQLSGTSVASTIDGFRPFLIEVQALVSTAVYGMPQRSSTGFDLRRLNMLLAVLEKRAGFRLGSKDVFLNIAGGLKVNDPAIDLAVIASVLSSNLDIALEKNICLAAEVGLTGEIRPVSKIEQRITESEKLGFNKIYISKYNKKGLNYKKFTIEIIAAGRIEEVVKHLFT